MFSKKIAIAALAGTALLAASGAYARHDDYRGYGYRHNGYNQHRYAPYRVVVRPAPRYYYAPAPVYYEPAPVYYEPAPVYYAPPRPVIYGSLPFGDARIRIGLQF